ncbi:hypothetical protein A2765_00430 [Candidatus Kaiserbacteria bacterium RIFCSPHIGHO2_01_FULL_56_24]|uniref:Glycosyltransferase 2-like domain-containing protein n=1 Tax=Candidatus Kaiserbacteria bacterium RIFCSPHIGHO2_01_FULL_56_24 TaxID=1798487 RepID=A0A1F6DBL6_9BACT|nr:MAG: hypothetical protein A2765_00430 [Candidatus Kaiserbacteria bacterium RIFCSPHIGHO2_01_FULL_56_24]
MTFQEGKIPATLVVLTKNSAETLEKALESAKDFDDIVICDGGSTDGTLGIAERFGARVITQDQRFLDEGGRIFDYAGVRNQTLDAARHTWILWLDSDEECTESLCAAIREVIAKRGEEGSGTFWVDRKYTIHGTVIDCAATYPNRQMRFFSKRSTTGFVKKVHERIALKEGVGPEFLDGVMRIPFEPDIDAIRRKWDYQIAVAAAQITPLSLWHFLEAVIDCTKISTLWFFRLARNAVFCSGTKMPFRFEMERHYFHLRLLRAFWKVTTFRTP